jgi:HsdM N-terminal domain
VFEQTFKNIDDVLWKEAGCATELDYTEQTSWILFLKYLDDLETANAQKAELTGRKYQPSSTPVRSGWNIVAMAAPNRGFVIPCAEIVKMTGLDMEAS